MAMLMSSGAAQSAHRDHPPSSTVWTIGHSRAPFERFVELLRYAGIEVLADVRSIPYSRHAPHAARERLGPALTAQGIRYVFLGDQLGGRPSDPKVLDAEGRPDYGKMAATDRFRAGLETLLDLARSNRTCIMCSEEDPNHCHRTRLIAPVLLERRVAIIHLRHDGTSQPHDRFF